MAEPTGNELFPDPMTLLESAQVQSPSGESVGRVEIAKGQSFITHTDGTKVLAEAGTPVFPGDVVETSEAGSVGIVFADDSTFSIAENGQMVIDEMIYDPGSQEGNSVFNVTQGVFTFVSGQIAKTGVDAMQVATPTATIGIRGTSGGGKVSGEGAPSTFTLFADPDGTVGEMTISTQVGSQTLNTVNQTTQIRSAFTLPSKPVVMPATAVQQFYASAAEALPPSPVGPAPEEGEAVPEGEGPITEGEAAADGEAEGDPEAEAQAEAEALADEAALPIDGELLPDGPIDGELEGDGQPLAEGDGLGEGEPIEGERPGGDPFASGPGEGEPDDGIEAAAREAAELAAQDALAAGATQDEAQRIAQQAALSAAQQQARDQGILEAEIEAASAAFNDALANGMSLDDAFAAAGAAGETASYEARLQFDEQFQPEGPDFGPSPGSQGEYDYFHVAPPGDDPGPGSGGDDIYYRDSQLQHVFDPLNVFGPQQFGLYEFDGYHDGEFHHDDHEDDNETTNQFTEFFSNFSLGNDSFSGGPGNTRFEMSTFGGDDQVFGGGGTDEMAFLNLSNAHGVYDSVSIGSSINPVITFQDISGSTSGRVTLNSVEQIFASDDGSDAFRVAAANSDGTHDAGYGIIIAGQDSVDDNLTAADGVTLSFSGTGHDNFVIASSSQTIHGGALFGLGGNDTLTAGDEGEYNLYGGSGNDSLTGKGSRDELYGGSGNDTLVGAAGNDSLTGGTGNDQLTGGAGNDQLTGGDGIDRFFFTGTNAAGLGLDLITDFSGTNAFTGGSGDGDKIVIDTSDLGISTITYEEVNRNGSDAKLDLVQDVAATVIVITGSAVSLSGAAALLENGNGTASSAMIIFRDTNNNDRLTMAHTDDLANNGTENALAVFSGVNTDVGDELVTADFTLQA